MKKKVKKKKNDYVIYNRYFFNDLRMFWRVDTSP